MTRQYCSRCWKRSSILRHGRNNFPFLALLCASLCLAIYLHALAQRSLLAVKRKYSGCLCKSRGGRGGGGEGEGRRVPAEDRRNLGARDGGLSDYYGESSMLESSAREMSLRCLTLLDRTDGQVATTDSIQPIGDGHLWWSEIPRTRNYLHS